MLQRLARLIRQPPASRVPLDFTLPEDTGETFVFDAAWRRRHATVLVWYRGHW